MDSAAFPFLEPHIRLGSCPGEEVQGGDEEPHVAWLHPEDSHLGGRVAIPESPEGDGVEGASMSTLLSFPDRGGSIHLCISAPVSWHLPRHPGIMTLRDQPVAEEQEGACPSKPANKAPLCAPEGGAADVVRRARTLKKDPATGPRSSP